MLEYHPSSSRPRALIIFIHGGCFSGGDVKLSSTQAKYLSQNLSAICICVPFSVASIDEALYDIEEASSVLQMKYPDIPCLLIGQSSGGYFALRIAQTSRINFDMVISICPVIDPFRRMLYLESDSCLLSSKTRQDMILKQLAFWKTHTEMKVASDRLLDDSARWRSPILCLYAIQDLNVPKDMIQEVLKEIPDSHTLKSGTVWISGDHSISFKSNSEVLSRIHTVLNLIA